MAGTDFLVTVGPEAPDQVFVVAAIQTPHEVTVGPAIPSTIYKILAAQEPTFHFTVSAEQADQVFGVRASKTFEVATLDVVDKIFRVDTIPRPNQVFAVRSFLSPPPSPPEDHVFAVSALSDLFRVTTEKNFDIYSYEELLALLAQDQADLIEAEEIAEDAGELADEKQAIADQSQQDFEEIREGQNAYPKVEDETNVDSGKDGPDVAEWIAVEISIALRGPTGNGDDGLGVITNWDVPEELRFNMNSLLFVSGEKVAGSAQLLELDVTGGLPTDANGSLLATTEGIINPDLFEDGEIFPDRTFFVDAGSKPPWQVFDVAVFANLPNQIFDVTTFAEPADQTFEIKAIEKYVVDVAQKPFLFTVFAEPADQIFEVRAFARTPDQTFEVTRGPDNPYRTFDAYVADSFEVTTSFAIPDKIFGIEVGPDPAPIPDFIFNISVGGPDAPPVPDPDEIFEVTTSFSIPSKIFQVKAIRAFDVFVQEAPFSVKVFAEPADQIFEVKTDAEQYDTKFEFTVGPEVPVQIFETTIVNEFGVEAYKPPVFYSVGEAESQNGDYNYTVTGNGLSFANQPEITLEFGQQLRFSLNTPANALWIKEEPTTGPGEVDPFWGTLLNQGSISGFLYFRPFQVGTYYYQSEFNEEAGGVITVTGTSAEAPTEIFEVTVGLDPTGFDELFVVKTGPEFPDEIFTVTAEGGAPPATQAFDVSVGPATPNKVFEVFASAPALSYSVINVGASDYRFNGEDLDDADDPDLQVETGQFVSLSVNAPGHPLWIKDAPGSGRGDASPVWAEVMSGNGNQLGGIQFMFNAPGTYYYNCEFHGGMGGEIIVTGDAFVQQAYAVSNSGSGDYLFTGDGLINEVDPGLTINVGEELVLAVFAPGHPLWIKNEGSTGAGEASPIWSNGMENNGTENGTIRLRFNTPGTYFYNCEYHSSMRGTITVAT